MTSEPVERNFLTVFQDPVLLTSVLSFIGDKYADMKLVMICKRIRDLIRTFRAYDDDGIESKKSAFLSSPRLAEWAIHELGMVKDEALTQICIESGYVDTLGFLITLNIEVNIHLACRYAARAGQVAMLEYLSLMTSPVEMMCTNTQVEHEAAKHGHINCLKWLRSKVPGKQWGDWVCTAAAQHGQLETLQWLRSGPLPCPWTGYTCAAAAGSGHLKVLKWLRSQPNSCPWGKKTTSFAAGAGHLEVLQWLRAETPPCPWDRKKMMALCSRHPHVTEWVETQLDTFEDERDSDDDEV